jgi:sugar phosphate isomerase/epimerase
MQQTPHPLAVQTWTIRDELVTDAEGSLKRLVGMGVQAVEVGGTGNMNWEQFGSICDKCALSVVGVHQVALDVAPVDVLLEEYIRSCAALRTKRVVVAFNPHRQVASSEYERYAEVMRELLPRLGAHEISLAYHCYTFDLVPLPDTRMAGARILLDRVRSSQFDLQLDTYFANRAGLAIETVLASYGDRCSSVHLNDVTADDRQAVVGDPSGLIDWGATLEMMGAAEPPMIYIVEHKTDHPFEWIERSLAFLRAQGLS